jgi:hypothetical protein
VSQASQQIVERAAHLPEHIVVILRYTRIPVSIGIEGQHMHDHLDTVFKLGLLDLFSLCTFGELLKES